MSQYLGLRNELFSKQNYNTNQNHPLQQSNQEYIYVDKFVSIHSEDRDLTKYPSSNEFEIEMPEDLLNIVAIKLEQWTFPSNYNTFSLVNNNISFSFYINNPYNPLLNGVVNTTAQDIYEALLNNINNPFTFVIGEGDYSANQMATELTNKFNYAVTNYIINYFTSQGLTTSLNQFISDGGYTNFVVVYNNVSCKLWFGNISDSFILVNENYTLTTPLDLSGNMCAIDKSQVPDNSVYGLSSYLGLPRCNVESINNFDNSINSGQYKGIYNGIVVPRFYYGDVVSGDNGYWLLPSSTLNGSLVNWVEATYAVNLIGEKYIYMELAGQNCLDETQPYNVSKFTLTTNQTNGIVNSSFAKIPIQNSQLYQCYDTVPSLYQWYDKDSAPYKWYLPPAERIRKLKFRFRYHNGRLVNFGTYNYSFMLKFVLQSPQILRSSNSTVYPAGKIF